MTKIKILAAAALVGVARTASAPTAADALVDRALSPEFSTERRIAVIRAISTAKVKESRTVSELGSVLTEKNQSLVQAALKTIAQLGSLAIRINLKQISLLATTDNTETAALARRIVERESSRH